MAEQDKLLTQLQRASKRHIEGMIRLGDAKSTVKQLQQQEATLQTRLATLEGAVRSQTVS